MGPAPAAIHRATAVCLVPVRGGPARRRQDQPAGGSVDAEAVVEGTTGQGEADARPSDALTLALLTGAPIRVDPAVIDEAAATPLAWDASLEELAEGAAEIVTERQAEWEQARAAVARARKQNR